jgi:hypothetical protein
MNLPHYKISVDPTFHTYQFISDGPRGQILKGVHFAKYQERPLVYNLALGDIDPLSGRLDDEVISNNNDRDIVLATVGEIVIDFCRHHLGSIVLAEGNTPVRKRLYQMRIGANLQEVKKHFEVFGFDPSQEKWELFEKNKTYEALLVKPIIYD